MNEAYENGQADYEELRDIMNESAKECFQSDCEELRDIINQSVKEYNQLIDAMVHFGIPEDEAIKGASQDFEPKPYVSIKQLLEYFS